MDCRTPGQVLVTFAYSRHMGPTCQHGGVTLSFDSLQPYSFESRARWPSGGYYEAQVRAAVESVLLERCGALDMCRVVLEGIVWDDVHSCAIGFERVARAATEMAFVV
jgi:hypothetical protein